MTTEPKLGGPDGEGAAAVMTHRVRRHKHAEYESWLNEIAPRCKASPGHLDWHIIRPIPGLTETYTVVIRFDTMENLRQWLDSSERKQLIEKAQPLFVTGDDFFISSGLDFWFAPTGAQAKLPARWKECLLTWSAIYPLATSVPLVVTPVLRRLGFPDSVLIDGLFATGTVVLLMVYVVMPRYTRLAQRWLFG